MRALAKANILIRGGSSELEVDIAIARVRSCLRDAEREADIGGWASRSYSGIGGRGWYLSVCYRSAVRTLVLTKARCRRNRDPELHGNESFSAKEFLGQESWAKQHEPKSRMREGASKTRPQEAMRRFGKQPAAGTGCLRMIFMPQKQSFNARATN